MRYVLLILLSFPSEAATDKSNVSSCQSLAKEKCISFRGRAAQYLGRAGTRIWQIGTRHLFEVNSQTAGAYEQLQQLTFHNKLFADFRGCPTEPFVKGAMQGICIESVKNARWEKIEEEK